MQLSQPTPTMRPLLVSPRQDCTLTEPDSLLLEPHLPASITNSAETSLVQTHEVETLPVISHAEMAEMVTTVLLPLDEIGKSVRVHPHLVGIQLWTLVLNHFTAHGEFFRAGGAPYYLDRIDRALISLDGGSPELGGILRQLGLLNGQQTTKVVVANLTDFAATSVVRPLYRLSYMAEDHSAAYLNAGGTRMYKITADAIVEPTIGDDGVVLLASDIAA